MTFGKIILLASALVARLTAAQADPLADLRALFPQAQPVCFARIYDSALLQAHPEQSVTAVRLLHSWPQLRFEDETSVTPGEPPPSPEQAARDYNAVMALLVVTFRDAGKDASPKRFAATVNCAPSTENGNLRCGIDCDGGGFFLERASDGALRVSLEAGNNLRIAGGCTSHRAYRGLGRGPGERSFTLTPAPMASCR